MSDYATIPLEVVESATSCRFFIPGLPRPGGSKRGFVVRERAVITEDCKTSKDWRAVCALKADELWRSAPPLSGPIAVYFDFLMPRPKGHLRKDGSVRPGAPAYPTVKPDVTKLIRSTEDALSRIIWRDDCIIVRQVANKLYTLKTPGCWVTIFFDILETPLQPFGLTYSPDV